MLVNDFLNLLVIILFLFLAYQFWQSLCLLLFTLQIKEYRWDRIKIFITTPSFLNLLKNNFNLFKIKKFVLPRLTIRTILIIGIIFICQYNFLFKLLRFIFPLLETIPNSLTLTTLFIITAAIFLIPLFTLIACFISEILIFPFKFLLIKLAGYKISRFKDITVIGITGSYGKTRTKDIITEVLSNFYKVAKTPENCNTILGIAITILKNLNRSHQLFVVEMGAYKRGEIKAICNLVKPKIGIITGINEQHLALFGTLKNTLTAKYELIEALPKDGMAIFNADDKLVLSLAKKTKINKRLYSVQDITEIHNKSVGFKETAAAALTLGIYLGISRQKLIFLLKKIIRFKQNPKILTGKNEVKIIDDSYSSNSNGFMAALTLLDNLSANKKIIITPGIIELGKASERIHKLIGKKMALIGNEIFLTNRDCVKTLKKALSKEKTGTTLILEEDADKLWFKIQPLLIKGNIILLEGRSAIRNRLLKL